jgi:hypothetical protein
MFNSHVYSSFDDCLAQISADFGVDLESNEHHRSLLLRGESAPYPKTEASMKRFLTGDDGRTIRPFYLVAPFIDFEEIYAEYHAEVHGLSDEEGVGFLQHYGFPTDLFDLSPSVTTARFFSCHGNESQPIGLLAAFPREQVEASFQLTDLSRHPFALRPRRQIAYAARPPAGLIDLKDDQCSELTKSRWYKFKKSTSDIRFAKSYESFAYPAESELAFFFSDEFIDFFQNHWAIERMSREQSQQVTDKLNAIREQLK